jgi:hypothetical protein
MKSFFNRVKNLIRWFPVIWKDVDWDDHFIFEILKTKLKHQADYIGKRGNHVSAERDAEIMMLCVRLIERIQDEYYGLEYLDYFKSDIRFVPSEEFPGCYQKEEIVLHENFDEYFKKYPLVYRMVPDLKASKQRIAHKMGNINQGRAHKLLFKLLERNILKWWD